MFQFLLVSVSLIILTVPLVFCDEVINTVVDTHSGPVRGEIIKTLYDEVPYYSFKGIPYAEPPVGKLRFKPPVPKKPWTNTLDAVTFGNVCLQSVYFFGEASIAGSEDCLFLNIYTPDVSSESKRAVMLFIHGGAFAEGSGNDDFYGPDFFINEDVVLVTINYRLAVLGFMSLGTPEYSGNMGLKDQNLALKWIKNNIERFGGDPDRITVFGHSAGAACTHYHVLSSESNSLFQRAIPMSGTALNFWSRYDPGDHMLHLFMLAKSTGTSLHTDKDLKAFLLSADAKYFVKNVDTSVKLSASPKKELELLWAPVIERKNAKNPFIQMKPEDILDNKLINKIDTMFGYTSAEMLFLISEDVNDPKLLEPFDKTFQLQLTINKAETYYDGDEYKQFAKEIRDIYFGEDVPISKETLAEYNDLLSDLFMVYGVDQSVKAHSKHSDGKGYYYRFSVEGKLNTFKTMFKTESMSGASHGDELCYLFRCRMFSELYENNADDSIEMKTIRAITKLFANFAKFGNPTPDNESIKLKPVRNNSINFVDITNDGLIPALGPNRKFNDFWEDLLRRHDNHVNDLKVKDEL